MPVPEEQTVAGREQEILSDLKTLISCAASSPERPAPSLQAGERRNCGILFLDLEGFTALSRLMSSEDLAVLVDRVFQLYTFEARKEGGYLDKVVGDAALYVFPGSEAHRHPAEAALAAGLGMQSRSEEVNASLASEDIRVRARIGVYYGEVTRLQVGGAEQPETVMGEAVNLAQRLEGVCPSGSILTTTDIADRTASEFVFSAPRRKELKGFGETDVCELEALETADRADSARSASRRTPFVGREAELDRLTAAVTSGSGPAVVWVTGETAVGKSRLIEEALDDLKQRGFTSAVTNTPAPPSQWFAGARLLTASLLDSYGPGEPEEMFDELLEELRGPDSEEGSGSLRLGLAFLLEVERGEEQLAQMDTEVKLDLARRALSRMLTFLADRSEAGLVVVIEDLQWIDEVSAELISQLIDGLDTDRVSFILSRRSGFENPFPGSAAHGETIELTRFTREQAVRLVHEMLPGVEFGEELLDQVISHAGGIPFFLEEFCRYLHQRGYLEEQAGRYRLARPVEQLEIPDSVEQMVLARLDRLNPRLRELVRHCAVLGRRFSTRLVIEVERGLESTSDPEQISADLEALADQGILQRLDEGEYRFSHLLAREAAYETTLTSSRRALHRLAADNLLALHPPGSASYFEALPKLIAHLKMSEQNLEALDQTLNFLKLAGNLGAMGSWEEYHAEAVELFREIDWEEVEADPELVKLVRESQWDPPQTVGSYLRPLPLREGGEAKERFGLRRAVMECTYHFRTGDWEKLEQDIWVLLSHPLLERMPDHYVPLAILASGVQLQQREADEAARTIELALDKFGRKLDPSLEARAYSQLGTIRSRSGNPQQAEKLLRKAEELYKQSGDSLRLGSVYTNLAKVLSDLQRYEEAMELFGRALESHERFGMRRSKASTLTNLATVHYQRGELGQASELLKEALEIHRDTSNRPHEAIVVGNLALVLQEQGELSEAEERYQRALNLNRELGNRRSEGVVLSNLAGLKRLQGDTARARELYEQALEILDQVQHAKFQTEVLTYLAELELEAGETDSADQRLERADEILTELGEGGPAVAWHAVRGRLAASRGDQQSALAGLREASALAGEFQIGKDVEYARPMHRLIEDLERAGLDPGDLRGELPANWRD